MKIFKTIIYSLAIIFMASCSNDKSGQLTGDITVEINYGAHKEKQKTIAWKPEITALEALQYAATIETHPVSNFVFVTSIDNVKGERGVTAWYYKINGKSPDKLAINTILNPGDTITWIYKKDVCSASVDNCKK